VTSADRFPLADWIDDHEGCRFNLGSSGMRGAVPPPPWPRRRVSREIARTLRAELADHLDIDPRRLFLAHGASEANAWVLGWLARYRCSGTRVARARVRYPEYPPLFDGARALGFVVRGDGRPVDVAVTSRPRNPGGELWTEETLSDFAEGARALVVDETFREFAEVPSVAARGMAGVWATGSFTKYFGADEVRVGYAVTPPAEAASFGRYVGLVSDEIAPASAAAALGPLRTIGRVRKAVRAVLAPNLAAFARAFPGAKLPAAPLHFDWLTRTTGRSFARRCLGASVLVCPGEYFGEPRGVRLCLTRRATPAALRAYRRVRDRWVGPPSAESTGV